MFKFLKFFTHTYSDCCGEFVALSDLRIVTVHGVTMYQCKTCAERLTA